MVAEIAHGRRSAQCDKVGHRVVACVLVSLECRRLAHGDDTVAIAVDVWRRDLGADIEPARVLKLVDGHNRRSCETFAQ